MTPGTTDLLFKTCTSLTIRRTVSTVDYTRFTTTVNVTVGGAPPAGSYTLHTMNDCSDVGAATLPELRSKARYIRVSPAGQKEAAPHDVIEVSTRTSSS